MTKIVDFSKTNPDEIRAIFAYNKKWNNYVTLIHDRGLYFEYHREKVCIAGENDALQVLKSLKESCEYLIETLESEDKPEEELIIG